MPKETEEKKSSDSKKSSNDNKKHHRDSHQDRRNLGKVLHPPSHTTMGNAGLWLEYYLTELRKEYGPIVKDLTLQNKYQREEPETLSAEELSVDNDPVGLKKAVMIKKHEHYWRKLEEDEEKYNKMYNVLWGSMSAGSQQLLKAEASFEEIEVECNPHKLVELVKQTHMCVDNYSQPVIQKDTLCKFYYGGEFKQFRKEPLNEFRKRFELLMSNFDRVGLNARKPDDAEAAWGFIQRLNDHQYPGIGSDLQYSVNMKVIQAPDTLDEAVDYVMKWDRSNRSYKSNSKSYDNSYSGAAMFHTAVRGGGRSGRGGGRGKGRGGRGGKGSGKGSSEKKANIECWNCHKKGHYSNECPDKKSESNDEKEAQNNVTMAKVEDVDSMLFVTKIIMTGHEDATLAENEVLLDNQAQASVVHNIELLKNIKKAKNQLAIFGISSDGKPMKTNVVGELNEFENVYYHPKAAANVLSMGEIEENHDVEYVKEKREYAVTIKNSRRVYLFKKRNRLYTRLFQSPAQEDSSKVFSVITVDENEKRFPKELVRRAREARRLSACLGHESDATLWKILHNGSYANMGITPDDIRLAREIYGPSVPVLKGTGVHKRAESHLPFQVEYNAIKEQVLHSDILYIERKVPFLLSVSKPLNLVMTQQLQGKSTSFIIDAFKTMIDSYTNHDFQVKKISYDSESAIEAAVRSIQSVEPSPVGPGQHEVVAESKIRRIKERMRAILHSLPYELPMFLVKYLLQFVVSKKNHLPVTGSGTKYSPRELFTGVAGDAKRDLRAPFGMYAQVDVRETNRSMDARTKGAIALYPVGNSQGSVRFLDLSTLKVVTRTHWTELPIPDNVIEYINSLSEGPGKRLPKSFEMRIGNRVVEDLQCDEDVKLPGPPLGRAVTAKPMYHGDVAVNDLVDGHQNTALDIITDHAVDQDLTVKKDPVDIKSEATEVNASASNLEESDTNSNSDSELEDEKINNTDESCEENSTSDEQNRRHTRSEGKYSAMLGYKWDKYADMPEYKLKHIHSVLTDYELQRATKFIFNLSVKKGIKLHGALAREAITNELKSILECGTIEPIPVAKYSELNVFDTLIPSHMMMREKTLPNGEFEKMKARLVGGGNHQDRAIYTETSSPTPNITSIFTVAALAANEGRHIRTADIGNAYLNASMDDKDKPVYMKLNREVSKFLCEIDSTFQEFKNDRHEIIVKLLKALYGCVQSSRLWFQHIQSTLINLGFKPNKIDQCVMNKTVKKNQCTVVIYVDDILITCKDMSVIDEVTNELIQRYKKVKYNDGLTHDYLGMHMDFSSPGEVNISMSGYIKELIKECNIKDGEVATSPANSRLFEDINQEKLSDKNCKTLHSIVAKLLYLGTRVRPEILLTVNYLSTRVNMFTEGDWSKAMRCLRYLNAEPELGLLLRMNQSSEISIHLYADASFAVHQDGKSHSAGVVRTGDATVAAKSTKQKLVTRSSSESELVCASDMLNKGLMQRDFIIEQGYKCGPVILHQDNMSTIKMISNGQSTSQRTRHINVRYFFIKERVDEKEVDVIYTRSEDMIADILTKPIQGKQFLRLRSMLLSSIPPQKVDEMVE